MLAEPTGYAYWHGASLFYFPTKGVAKHSLAMARRQDRLQWGTSQSPSRLISMGRSEAESIAETTFFS
jgi:hypothetical protein